MLRSQLRVHFLQWTSAALPHIFEAILNRGEVLVFMLGFHALDAARNLIHRQSFPCDALVAFGKQIALRRSGCGGGLLDGKRLCLLGLR